MCFLRRTIFILLLLFATNPFFAAAQFRIPFYLISVVAFMLINIFPAGKMQSKDRFSVMLGGYEMILLYGGVTAGGVLLHILYWLLPLPHVSQFYYLMNLAVYILLTGIMLLNGLLRISFTSVQLGVKWRALLLSLWWVPAVNVILISNICGIVRREYGFETKKRELDLVRRENEICNTKYPLLLVHGVFFRDMRFLNYWGRVPAELVRNGAVIFYGEQQSAASVADSAEELRKRIIHITKDLGYGKVNVIAHSKGGLDMRYAVSRLGMDRYVASLTTISTPHRGCAFAEFLLQKAPPGLRRFIAAKYNSTLKKLGDTNPDFMGAVTDLTMERCAKMNEETPDKAGVFYQSVMSKMSGWRSGRFPLNFTYLLVKWFDPENDGLVSVDSAKWGSRFQLLSPEGKRGISHGDIVDICRENIPGFDVREFYVDLVKDLKKRGF